MLSKADKQNIEGLVTLVRDRKEIILSNKDSNKDFKDSQVLFHIEADDFFATIATVLRLARERLGTKYGAEVLLEDEIIEEVEHELLYLQKNYSIKKK